MTDKLTYEQQTHRIATLERRLAYMTEKEAQLAAQVAELEDQNIRLAHDSGDYKTLLDRLSELEEWAYAIYVGYRDGYGWIESETDNFVVSRPDVIRKRDEREGMVRPVKTALTG